MLNKNLQETLANEIRRRDWKLAPTTSINSNDAQTHVVLIGDCKSRLVSWHGCSLEDNAFNVRKVIMRALSERGKLGAIYMDNGGPYATCLTQGFTPIDVILTPLKPRDANGRAESLMGNLDDKWLSGVTFNTLEELYEGLDEFANQCS
ncbi:MAG: hypothetical protein LBT59_11590 [Clostridiales bacterium]|jgi:hypothetical protein|nr:hypothetical protein [Clostridiales bacterium]